VPSSSPEELDAYTRAFDRLMDVLRLLHASGVPLWPGPTTAPVHPAPGVELLADIGMPAAEVLRVATQGCATHLGLGDSHGSVETGQAAALVLLDGDPTTDISVVRRIRAVMNGKSLYFPARSMRNSVSSRSARRRA